MLAWDMWKKGFNTWEDATAKYLEVWLKNPLVLNPSGAMLTAALKAKVVCDNAAATCWGVLGLPTRRNQERTLHALNQLESRLLDMEERLNSDSASARK